MPRLLVVDDEEGAVETLSYILEGEGFDIVPALNGKAAMAALAAEPFDLVLLDIVMPDADGLLLCQEIRRQYPQTPVILMTGYYAENAFDEVERMAGVRLMHKPLQIAQLINLCREMCSGDSVITSQSA